MRKMAGRVGICLLIPVLLWCGALIADRRALRQELIRIHIVANSDSREDQSLKLSVRDAVMKSLKNDLRNVADVKQAKAYLAENLSKLQQIAHMALQSQDCTEPVRISLGMEEFDTKSWNGFTFPAGIYHALRIVIGDGAGENWWCVAFPADWTGKSTEPEQIEAGSGFHQDLDKTLNGEYKLRLACLELLGKLENILFPDE